MATKYSMPLFFAISRSYSRFEFASLIHLHQVGEKMYILVHLCWYSPPPQITCRLIWYSLHVFRQNDKFILKNQNDK
jgi:hypothetical protein